MMEVEERILVIDNDVETIDQLKKVAEKYKYKIDNTDNFMESKELIIKNYYSLYFISLIMNLPELTNLINFIKENNYNAKIIIMAIYSNFSIEEQIRPLGITYYLTKPIVETEIKELLGEKIK